MKKVNITFLGVNVTQTRTIINPTRIYTAFGTFYWKDYIAHEHIVEGTNLYNCIINLKEGEEAEYDASGNKSWNCVIKVRLNKIIE